MSKRAWLLTLAAAVTSAVVVPVAGGPAGSATPAFKSTAVYVKCLDGSKVQNAAIADGKVVTWNKQRPYLNFVSGAAAGCWYTDDDVSSPPLTWQGTVTGNLRALTVNVDDFVGVHVWRAVPLQMKVSHTIDGQKVVDGVTVALPAKGTDLRNGGLTQLATFSVTGLESRFGRESGEGTRVHRVAVSFSATTGVHNWTWGCTEAPSGIVFNPPVAAPPAIPAR